MLWHCDTIELSAEVSEMENDISVFFCVLLSFCSQKQSHIILLQHFTLCQSRSFDKPTMSNNPGEWDTLRCHFQSRLLSSWKETPFHQSHWTHHKIKPLSICCCLYKPLTTTKSRNTLIQREVVFSLSLSESNIALRKAIRLRDYTHYLITQWMGTGACPCFINSFVCQPL